MLSKVNKQMKIFISGNPLVEDDKLAMELKPDLIASFPNIEFLELDSAENFPPNLIIIDVIKGHNEIIILEDLDKIELQGTSMHDFDLGFNLKLLNKMGRLDSIKIIGIPYNMKKQEALERVKNIISNLF